MNGKREYSAPRCEAIRFDTKEVITSNSGNADNDAAAKKKNYELPEVSL